MSKPSLKNDIQTMLVTLSSLLWFIVGFHISSYFHKESVMDLKQTLIKKESSNVSALARYNHIEDVGMIRNHEGTYVYHAQAAQIIYDLEDKLNESNKLLQAYREIGQKICKIEKQD